MRSAGHAYCRASRRTPLRSCPFPARPGPPVAAPLPPLANPGGPPFLNGAVFTWNETLGKPTSLGLVANGSLSFAEVGADGAVDTVMGRYTSWECIDPATKPGEYRAMLEYVWVSEDSNRNGTRRSVCEFGAISFTDGANTWAQAEDACPVRWLAGRVEGTGLPAPPSTS